jgi:hypothetical protein
LAIAGGVAALLLISANFFFSSGPKPNGPAALSAFALLSQASAAEADVFAQPNTVHIVSEIVVKPISDPRWAQARWFPLTSLSATGKPRAHQLKLPAEVGEGYTIKDQAWYDPPTRRFIRLLTEGETPIFANSFDGQAIYDFVSDAAVPIARSPITDDFKAPEKPAEFLGIGAGMPNGLDESKRGYVDISDAGELTLDGSPARVVKVAFRQDGAKQKIDAHYLYTIREDTNTIAQIEFKAQGESLFVIRRVKTEQVEKPAVPWNLAGIESRAGETQKKPDAKVMSDMVIPNVSVEHMLKEADFEVYLFASDPPWAGERHIIDLLDIASPPRRMFLVTYRAEDGRHVVLMQSHTMAKAAEAAKKSGKVSYESPSGVKVWSGPQDKHFAGILLQSATASIKDPPSEDRIGMLLETPDGTFPALAVNGQISDEELHALIDSLKPAKR